MADLARRGFLLSGLGALICAPAIIRAGSLMPIKAEPVMLNQFIVTGVSGNAVSWEEMSLAILQPMIDRLAGKIEQDIMQGHGTGAMLIDGHGLRVGDIVTFSGVR